MTRDWESRKRAHSCFEPAMAKPN